MPAAEEVYLWVKTEVLELGVLPILTPDKVSVDMLSRLLQYCQELGVSGFPKMSYHTWKHIAVKKMSLSVECAMVVFYSCLLFSQQQPSEMCVLEAELAAASTHKQRDEILSEVEVHTFELALLLYLHRMNITHPRAQASQVSLQALTTDPWPGKSKLVSSTGNQLLEEQYVVFIKESLPEILSLLSGHLGLEDTEKRRNERRSAKDLLCFMRSAGVLSPEVVQALSFIIGISQYSEKKESNLLTVATDKHHSYHSGYLSKKKSFQKGLFEQWILRRLDWAPHGEWLCSRRGRRLNWPVTFLCQQSSHKILMSPSLMPNRLILVSDLCDGMTFQMEEDDYLTDLKLRKCSRSNLYILQPHRYVTIQKCSDCRIVLGPVSGRIKLSDCRNCVVICAARSIVVSDSRAITIHTLSPQRPLLVGSRTQGITLAPLNFHYPKLMHHLGMVSMLTSFNIWNRPLHLSYETVSNDSFSILAADDFHLLAMPFCETISTPLDGKPPLLPPGVPQDYINAIEAARENVSSLRAEIREANLSQEKQTLLQKTIDARFKTWLRESNRQKELDQLNRMEAVLKYRRATKTTAI